MNFDKVRRLKIQKLPQVEPAYEARILVISISPSRVNKLINIEVRVKEWVINWN